VADHPFLSLVVEALNLTHPRFALANGREYTPEEAGEPAAARKVRERSFLMEFYHEFRRLWDRAVPVQRGLGHIAIQADPEAGSRSPDLLFWQLGEQGASDRRLAALSIAFRSNPDAVTSDRALLARWRTTPGYPLAVSVVVGRAGERMEAPEGVTVIEFDIEKWQTSPGEPGNHIKP
jgi:hypothetical protein